MSRLLRCALTMLISLALLGGLGLSAATAAASTSTGERVSVQADGRIAVSIKDRNGVTGTVVVGLTDGRFSTIDINAQTNRVAVRDTLTVDDFALLGERDFRVNLRTTRGDTSLRVDTTRVEQQAVPALLLLGALARLGIGHVIKWFGKAQLKKAAKSYLLNNVRADKWTHIMQPKHKWGSVGARSREEIAELMSRAMAEGEHVPYGSGANMARWNHNGQTIEVTYAKNGGQIANGWVK